MSICDIVNLNTLMKDNTSLAQLLSAVSVTGDVQDKLNSPTPSPHMRHHSGRLPPVNQHLPRPCLPTPTIPDAGQSNDCKVQVNTNIVEILSNDDSGERYTTP